MKNNEIKISTPVKFTVHNHPVMYEEVGVIQEVSSLQPGDALSCMQPYYYLHVLTHTCETYIIESYNVEPLK